MRISQKNKRLVWPISLLTVTVMLYAGSILVLNFYKWKPLSILIDMRPGVTRFPVIKVNFTAVYDIKLEVDRKIPFEQLVCLMGLEGDSNYQLCKNISSPVELTWVLFSNGVALKEGTSHRKLSGGYGSTITRSIGAVSLEEGKDYLLEVTSLRDASVLASTSPRITVEAQAPINKPYAVIAQLLSILAFLCGGIGIISIIWIKRMEP
ncbi:MAG: hypothetical protein WC405_01405 [Syntrophales bacterium]